MKLNYLTSQSYVKIKWSSNNINFIDSTFICYYLQKRFISDERMVQDKVAKSDRGKAGGALMRRAVNEVTKWSIHY